MIIKLWNWIKSLFTPSSELKEETRIIKGEIVKIISQEDGEI